MNINFGAYKIVQGITMVLFGILVVLKQWVNLSNGIESLLMILSFVLVIVSIVFNLFLIRRKKDSTEGLIKVRYLVCFTFFNVAALINFTIWFLV